MLNLSYVDIETCEDVDALEIEKEKAYANCVYYNDCSVCVCANEDGDCDLTLIVKRIHELYRLHQANE